MRAPHRKAGSIPPAHIASADRPHDGSSRPEPEMSARRGEVAVGDHTASVAPRNASMPLRLRIPNADGSALTLFSDEGGIDFEYARSVARALLSSPEDRAVLQRFLSGLDRMEARGTGGPAVPAEASAWKTDLLRVLRG